MEHALRRTDSSDDCMKAPAAWALEISSKLPLALPSSVRRNKNSEPQRDDKVKKVSPVYKEIVQGDPFCCAGVLL